MNRLNRKERRGARLAVLLTLLTGLTFDLNVCRAQTAGFAQSRQQAPARAESGGGVREFVASLNPFKKDGETQTNASSYGRVSLASPNAPSAVQERAALVAPPAYVAPQRTATGRKIVGDSTSTTSAGRSLGTTRASIAAPSQASNLVSGAKSSTGGVAALLLDELQEEIGDEPTSFSPKNRTSGASRNASVKRRSLREDESLDALELIDSDSEIVAEEADEANAVFTTDSDAEIVADEEDTSGVESLETADEDGPAIPVLADSANVNSRGRKNSEPSSNVAKTSKATSKTRKTTRSTSKTDSLDARFDEILDKNGVDDVVEITETFNETGASKSARKRVVAPDGTAWGSSNDSDIAESDDENEPVAAETKSEYAAESRVSVGSPVVEIETLGPKKLVVGQETTYKIRVRNSGEFAANKLVVSTELPEAVAASNAVPQVGSAGIEDAPIESVSGGKRCVWKVGTLAPGAEYELTLTLTPIKRSAFELVSDFEFERSAARTGVEVQEPILEARVEGRDEIEWGVEDKYRLRVRNVGNGDAENVDLFVSTGENEATQRLGVLKAGEEKTIEMAVKTILDASISINVRATGEYGVEALATKTIAVLRGKLETTVETPELQFVDGEFEAIVRARNIGDAPLQDVDVVAQTPESVELLSYAGNGRRDEEKRRIYWSVPLLRPGEEAAYRIQCRLTRSGDATFAVVGSERSGETTQAEATVQVESIAALAMRVKAPKAPVAVGKECVYELMIENNGTKDAEDVDSGIFLGSGMKPIAVEGERGSVFENESKVIFENIERLPAGETVVFRVRAEAVAPGNHKVQAMLQSLPEDARLLSEETTYCYDRSRTTRNNVEQSPSIVALEPSQTETSRRK